MSEENRKFAFGDDSYDGHKSPAVEAGYSTMENPTLSRVEGKYDEFCLKDDTKPHTGEKSKGVISETMAKVRWNQVIEYYDQFSGKERQSKWAHKIADELGWK